MVQVLWVIGNRNVGKEIVISISYILKVHKTFYKCSYTVTWTFKTTPKQPCGTLINQWTYYFRFSSIRFTLIWWTRHYMSLDPFFKKKKSHPLPCRLCTSPCTPSPFFFDRVYALPFVHFLSYFYAILVRWKSQLFIIYF